MSNNEVDRTLWVGNLSDKVTRDLLYELFLQAGPLDKVVIPKDKDGKLKKFAFVTFKHDVSVPYTINLLNGTALFGRELRLQSRPGSIHNQSGQHFNGQGQDQGQGRSPSHPHGNPQLHKSNTWHGDDLSRQNRMDNESRGVPNQSSHGIMGREDFSVNNGHSGSGRSPSHPDGRSPNYPDGRSPSYQDARSPNYPDGNYSNQEMIGNRNSGYQRQNSYGPSGNERRGHRGTLGDHSHVVEAQRQRILSLQRMSIDNHRNRRMNLPPPKHNMSRHQSHPYQRRY